MSFRIFLKELNGNRVEGELIRTIFYSLLTSFVFLSAFYFLFSKSVDNFIGKYGVFLLFSVLSYAFIVATVRQVRAYKEFACMSGMMIGMTSGMMGFLPGFYVASTNGMFVGGFFGVFIGMVLGIWNGKCCGVMGVMEGMMAGFMGGLMGAMTAFMLLNDHLLLAAVLVFLICAIILFGLNYMIYFEMKESERQKREDHWLSVILTFVLVLLTLVVMLYGPRSLLFQ